MNLYRRTAIAALTAAGLLWGTTVPMTKLALEWLPPGWLTIARFGLAAAVLLVALRFRVRAACSPAVLAWGAVGYGGSILVQNAGVGRTSVSHAALLVGATPVLVAVMAAIRHRSVARPVAWVGFAVSFAGVGLVAAGGGGGTTFTGDALVLASLGFSASFTVAQARLLSGRDPVAVTAVQFLVAALATLPIVAATEGVPPAPAGADALLATAGLAIVGTLAPSTLFAYGQARVSAESAGAFVNLEPLVGAAAGTVLFGDPVGMAQAAGGAAVLAGIALSSLPLLPARRPAGRRGTGIATTVVGAGRAGGHLPPGRPAPPPGERPGRGRALLLPHSGHVPLPYLPRVGRATATWRRGGGGSDVTDERRPPPNPPPGQRPDPNEEFRRALERETDLSLREDPERRRLYTSMDLPRSRSPGDDQSLPPRRHHRHDELTWNGETLTLIGWSQRTGIRVEVLLRRCRRGWPVEQVLTTPLGEDRSGPHAT